MNTTLSTNVCSMLGIRYPIILAGMGGAAGPELTAAVSNAGGLGVLGAVRLQPDELDRWITEVRSLTSEPFGVDTLLPPGIPDDASEAELKAAVPQAYWDVLDAVKAAEGLPDDADVETFLPALSLAFCQRQMEVILDHRVPVYAAALGSPRRYMADLHQAGIKVMAMAGHVRSARGMVDTGVDIVVAQGHDAAGHGGPIGTMSLIPQIVDAVGDVPVVAAGGIADGRGLLAALSLGAGAAWIGTRFLATPEARIPDGQKEKILAAVDEGTMVTKYKSGKRMRMLKSPLPAEFERRGLDPLPLPLMSVVSGPLFGSAIKAGRFDLEPGSAGQGAGLVSTIKPAAQVVTDLMVEATEGLERLNALSVR